MIPFAIPAASFYAEATTTSGTDAVEMVGTGNQLLIKNGGTVVVYVQVGGAGVEATDDSMALLGGENRVYTIDPNATFVAVLAASSTARVYFSRSNGGN